MVVSPPSPRSTTQHDVVVVVVAAAAVVVVTVVVCISCAAVKIGQITGLARPSVCPSVCRTLSVRPSVLTGC